MTEENYTNEPCNCYDSCYGDEPVLTSLKSFYIVNDASGLTKFKKGEEVTVLDEPNENGEVHVKKMNGDEKVKYTIRFDRLRPLYYENPMHQTTFDEIRNKKTFTDATIEKAEEMYDSILSFVEDVMYFKSTLENTAGNLRTLAGDLLAAIETKDSKKLLKLMNNCKETIKFLKEDPMIKDLKGTMKQFDTRNLEEEEFNPIDLIG